MLVLEELSKLITDPAIGKNVVEYDIQVMVITDIVIAVGLISACLITSLTISTISWFARKEIPKIAEWFKKHLGGNE